MVPHEIEMPHIACTRLERAGTGAQTPERLRVGAGAMRFDVAAQYSTSLLMCHVACARVRCDLDGARSVAPPCMLMVLDRIKARWKVQRFEIGV